jgi:hypothetical protein
MVSVKLFFLDFGYEGSEDWLEQLTNKKISAK